MRISDKIHWGGCKEFQHPLNKGVTEFIVTCPGLIPNGYNVMTGNYIRYVQDLMKSMDSIDPRPGSIWR